MDPFVAADFKNGLYSLLHSCVPGYITWTCVNASYECCQASSDLSMVMIPYDSAESNDHGTGYLESYVFRDISYHLARGISRATPAELVHGIVGLAYVASGNSRDPVETVDTYAVGLTELCAACWLDAGIHPMFCHVIPAAIESGRSELEISLLRRVLLSQAAVNDVYDILNDLIRGSGVSYVAALLQYDPDHAVLTVARRIIGQIAPIADHAISSGNYWLVRAYFMNLLFFEWSPRYYSAKQVEATELMTWEGETSVSSGFDWLSSPVSSNTTPNTLASLSADLATRGYACGANVCKGGFCASGTRLLQSLDALYRLDPGSGPPNDLSVCQQLLHWYTFHETGSRFLTFATYAQEALNRALK